MTGLDYLLTSQFFICIMLMLVFYVVWKTVERKPYVMCFCFIYVFGIIAGFCNVLVSSVPSHAGYWIIYTIVFQVILGLLLVAVRLRAGKKWLENWNLAIVVAPVLIVMWASLVHVHVGMQMAAVPYCAAWVLFESARQLREHKNKTRLASRWAANFLTLYSLAMVASGTAALLQGADFDPFYLEWYNRFTFIAQPSAFAGTGIFIVLMLADDMAVKMLNLSITDQLTELLNRRGFDNAVSRIIAHSRRNNTSLAVVIADLDNFKKINDKYSHHIGDVTLKKFADNASEVLRKSDVIARIGGEEFAILLVDTPLDEAEKIVERLRTELKGNPVDVSKDEQLTVTCSFGVVMLDERHNDIYAAMREADEALYEAKEAGRDQYKVFQFS